MSCNARTECPTRINLHVAVERVLICIALGLDGQILLGHPALFSAVQINVVKGCVN